MLEDLAHLHHMANAIWAALNIGNRLLFCPMLLACLGKRRPPQASPHGQAFLWGTGVRQHPILRSIVTSSSAARRNDAAPPGDGGAR
jgi:hypothetical protein